MPSQSIQVAHPGGFIRGHVIPSGMSVSKAASKLGVSRPTLSKLLNGKSSLSHQMAVKLERAFGADHQELLDRQTKFDRVVQRKQKDIIASHIYIPKILTMKANDIHTWAQKLEARQLLPVLLRKLIRSTGQDLSRVDFPGYDRAEQKGWDGVVESEVATPWIPRGKSCWELSTQANPNRKAKSDYEARVNSVLAKERRRISFVFVTARNWPTKNHWIQEMNPRGHWKSVHAYDASDLEQWLEESISASIWFAEQSECPTDGVETLEAMWQRWRNATDPPMSPDIFEQAIETHRSMFDSWLLSDPERPLLVTADSKDEAMAFVACLFDDRNDDRDTYDLGLIFRSDELLCKLVETQSPFIPIVCSTNVEAALAHACGRRHCIIVKPRYSLTLQPEIRINPLDDMSFERALNSMGLGRDCVIKLRRASGRSPTVLRRQLATVPAIKIPLWAEKSTTARILIPMALVGTWREESDADQKVLEKLVGKPYKKIEKAFTKLLIIDDSPVWGVGKNRGVVSQMDAIFAISWHVTSSDIKKFLKLAKLVLSEEDPSLDLPDDQRWLAELHHKVRRHSNAIRRGISESLVILSVYCDDLFGDRIELDIKAHIERLIHDLIHPLTPAKLRSHEDEIPMYAEAAPEVFMNSIEHDLRKSQPAVCDVLMPVDESILTPCPRAGLLWGLECLAWKNLGRVSKILAKLSGYQIDDRFANTPMNSLKSIYGAFMPQTSATEEQRIEALETLASQFPSVAWRICMHQLSAARRIGSYNYRPRWRADAHGHGEPRAGQEQCAFRRKAIDMAINWPAHNAETFCDLVQFMQELKHKDQMSVLKSINSWSQDVDDHAKSRVRESIRMSAIIRRRVTGILDPELRELAQNIYSKLEPKDPVLRYAKLFQNPSQQVPDDQWSGKADRDLDPEAREEMIREQKILAIEDVLKMNGIAGLVNLASAANSSEIVNKHLELYTTNESDIIELLKQYLSLEDKVSTRDLDRCVHDFLQAIEEDLRISVISSVASLSAINRVEQVFRCAPFKKSTWQLLERQNCEIRDRYWCEVNPVLTPDAERHLTEVIDNLLDVQRPDAAFHIASLNWDRLESLHIKRILLEVATVESPSSEHYPVQWYSISRAFQVLDRRMDIGVEEMARLEFPYTRILTDSDRGIPCLASMVASSPEFFVELVVRAYRRKDGEEDPSGWHIDDAARRQDLASVAMLVLDTVDRMPGTDPMGCVDVEVLDAWTSQVRKLCAICNRKDIGDQCIGQLLSRVSVMEEDTWPCLPVCRVIETFRSEHIDIGFHVGTINQRGAHWRSLGGRQEREIAARYHSFAQDIAIKFPRVSSVVTGIGKDYEDQAKWWDRQANTALRNVE